MLKILVEKIWQFVIFFKKETTDIFEYKRQIISIPAIKIKFLEALIYYLFVTHRSKKNPIVYLHKIGCDIVLPMLKFVAFY